MRWVTFLRSSSVPASELYILECRHTNKPLNMQSYKPMTSIKYVIGKNFKEHIGYALNDLCNENRHQNKATHSYVGDQR